MFLHPLECPEESSHERIASLQWCEQPCKLRRYGRKQTLPRTRASRQVCMYVCVCVCVLAYGILIVVQVTRSSPVSFVPSVSIVDNRSRCCSFDYWRCEFVVLGSREVSLYRKISRSIDIVSGERLFWKTTSLILVHPSQPRWSIFQDNARFAFEIPGDFA